MQTTETLAISPQMSQDAEALLGSYLTIAAIKRSPVKKRVNTKGKIVNVGTCIGFWTGYITNCLVTDSYVEGRFNPAVKSLTEIYHALNLLLQ